ncbi:hypothetical protein BX616_005352, partial [Lobosporangium transversale]
MPKGAKPIRKSARLAALAKKTRTNGRRNPSSSASSIRNMNSTKLRPLDIPEILLLIGGFLDQDDLLNCIRVSKNFYRAFIRIIWRKITIVPFRYPSGKTLQNHKQYIEEINFEANNIPEEYGALQGCDRLQTINYEGNYSWDEPICFLSMIWAHSSTITRVCLENVLSSYWPWKTLLECVHLNHLGLSFTYINGDGVDIFFQVCKKVKHLNLARVSIKQLPINFLSSEGSEYVLPSIHTLRIEDVDIISPPDPYTSSYCVGMLVRKCPGLCALEYGGYDLKSEFEQSAHEHFYRGAFLQHPWTLNNLTELSFFSMIVTDEDMAILLRRVTGLKRLDVQFCAFGPLSMRELLAEEQEVLEDGQIVRKRRDQRLCDTIEVLGINIPNIRSDGIAQAILTNCPRLKRLAGSRITIAEIVNGVQWVSTGLTHLEINLVADVDQETAEGMAKARIAFKQLGKLTQLRCLDLTVWPLEGGERRTLDLRLRAGLDELANLKSLHTLAFRDDHHQQIELGEATWILNNWPSIRCLKGCMDLILDKELNEDEKDIYTSITKLLSKMRTCKKWI